MNTVAFTVHQRPWYLRETLEEWRLVRGIKDWRVAFHIDPSTQTQAMLDICKEFSEWHGVTAICTHGTGKGVNGNPFHALDDEFKHDANFVVLAEEDVRVGADVLEYFTWAQQFDDLLATCAWSDGDALKHPYNASRRKWFNPWCWQTSRTMWESVIRPTWDFDYSTADERGVAGWDCNLGLRIVHDYNLDVLFPHRSRSMHIGKWAGVHQDPSKHGEQEMPTGFVDNATGNDWKEVPYVHV